MVNFRFDEGFDELDAAPVRAERENVPEGTHDFQIKQVIDTDERLEVRLEHDDRRFGWVFCRLPKKAVWAKRLVGQLVKAMAMTQDEWLAVDVGDLAGRRVRAEIVHVQKDRLFVNVDKFLPIEQLAAEVAAKAPSKRSQSAKATAALSEQAKDDIPF